MVLSALVPRARLLIAALLLSCFCSGPALAGKTPLATGNGFGFAVFSFDSGSVNGLYAHPYKFVRPDPKEQLGEGIETTNFIDSAAWETLNTTGNKSFSSVKSRQSNASYVQESQIIEVKDKCGSQFLFMPFDLAENALIYLDQPNAVNTAKDRVLKVKWKYPVTSVSREDVTGHIAHHLVQLIRFSQGEGSLLLVPLGVERAECTQVSGSISLLKGSAGWAVLSVDGTKDVSTSLDKLDRWLAKTSPQSLVPRELDALEKWRVQPKVHFNSESERKLWRQSETVLRMAQIREPNNDNHTTSATHSDGLILASLPDGAWWVPWVRDMVYATLALEDMGHHDEARLAVQAFFNARPVGKMEKEVGGPYQVSVVRYFGDGSEEPYFTMEGATNIEFDNWGLVLWALGNYCRTAGDDRILDKTTYRGSVFESARDFVVRPLLENLEPYKDGLIVGQDTSIWEEKQKDKKHFAYSTMAAIKGLESFAALAKGRGDQGLSSELESKLALLRKGFAQAFTSSGKLRGALEDGIKNEVDGAMLSAITLGVVQDKGVIDQTIAAMDKLKMPSGGYRRVHSIVEDPAIFEYWYERQEFLFINFSLASVYLQTGQPDKARALIDPMVEKSAKDNYFVPEMYVSEVNDRFKGALGEPIGAIPMVGYGAGVYISYILEREKILHPMELK